MTPSSSTPTASSRAAARVRRHRGGAPLAAADADEAAGASVRENPARFVWAAARLALGWIFLWAFLDKLFGLGQATPSGAGWIDGGNPTEGYLSGATGPFAGIYHDIAGAGVVNWLFMLGLLFVGAALMSGVAMRLACGAGALMMVLMWSSALWPETNPFMDDHLVYALLLGGLALVRAGDTLGLGRRWSQSALVQRLPWLA